MTEAIDATPFFLSSSRTALVELVNVRALVLQEVGRGCVAGPDELTLRIVKTRQWYDRLGLGDSHGDGSRAATNRGRR